MKKLKLPLTKNNLFTFNAGQRLHTVDGGGGILEYQTLHIFLLCPCNTKTAADIIFCGNKEATVKCIDCPAQLWRNWNKNKLQKLLPLRQSVQSVHCSSVKATSQGNFHRIGQNLDRLYPVMSTNIRILNIWIKWPLKKICMHICAVSPVPIYLNINWSIFGRTNISGYLLVNS